MKHIHLGNSDLKASELIMGCMRIDALTESKLDELIQTALDQGISLFDHADIYGGGKCESRFGKYLKKHPHKRHSMLIQSKCGIRQGFYDLSKAHILKSVDDILKRLGTDYLDLFLLHRPDTFIEPSEVAEAFDLLASQGKVRHFGVSNMSSHQVDFLKTAVRQSLIVNQLQFSPVHANLVTSGLQVNTAFKGANNTDGNMLEYSRMNQMTLQAWSPFQYGFFEGIYIDHPDFTTLNQALMVLADEKGVTKSAIAASWILSHPAKMQVILGTTNPNRLIEICKASDITLSKKEWYDIYLAAGHTLP